MYLVKNPEADSFKICGLSQPMALATLKPRLSSKPSSRISTLSPKAGSTQMERGRAWQAKRIRIARQHDYKCAACGLVWLPSVDQIDHIVPREQGGSNEDSNLQPLCNACHVIKTAEEAKARAGR